MSNSARPHRWEPTRLPHPWDSPSNNTRVGCHFLFQCMKVKSESEVAQSCPTQRHHGLQPSRLLRPWDFPGKSTGVGCHCLLRQCDKVSLIFILYLWLPCGSAGKESSCSAGDLGLPPELGRSPGEGKGYPLQYSGLENSMDYQWGCKESDTTERLSLHYLGKENWVLSKKTPFPKQPDYLEQVMIFI